MSDKFGGAGAVGPSGLPDAGDFIATSSCVDPSEWSVRATSELRAAADHGVLVAGRERLLAARGVAATLPLPDGLEDGHALSAVRAWLADIEDGSTDVEIPEGVARGPVALGAFAFERSAPAELVVPSVTWCREVGGRVWRVEVRRRDDA
ncbi:MAG: hypothetical protein ACRDXC_00300, partial [Acidimicrobiales bacterium]